MRTGSAGGEPSSNITLPVKKTTRSALLSISACPGFWPFAAAAAASSSPAHTHVRQPILSAQPRSASIDSIMRLMRSKRNRAGLDKAWTGQEACPTFLLLWPD